MFHGAFTGFGRALVTALALVSVAGGCAGRPADSRPFRAELPLGTILRLELIHPVGPSHERGGTPFLARVVRPVEVGGQLVMPAGSLARGTATALGGGDPPDSVRFHVDRIALPNGLRVELGASCVATGRYDSCRWETGPPEPRLDRPAGARLDVRVDETAVELVAVR